RAADREGDPAEAFAQTDRDAELRVACLGSVATRTDQFQARRVVGGLARMRLGTRRARRDRADCGSRQGDGEDVASILHLSLQGYEQYVGVFVPLRCSCARPSIASS